MSCINKETKEYKVLVEKENKMLVLAVLLSVFCVSAGIGGELQAVYPHLNVNFWIPCIALVLLVILGFLLDKFVDFKEILTVIFLEDQVVLKRKTKKEAFLILVLRKLLKLWFSIVSIKIKENIVL